MEGRLQTARFDWIGTISRAFVYLFILIHHVFGTEWDKPLNRTSSSVIVFT